MSLVERNKGAIEEGWRWTDWTGSLFRHHNSIVRFTLIRLISVITTLFLTKVTLERMRACVE